MATSLYDRLGGEIAINAAIDMFCRKVLSDDALAPFFDSTDMDEQRSKQKAFLTMVFGGPNEYIGADLRTAHAPWVEKGLDDSHFDSVAGHLKTTLEELGVAPKLVGEVIALAASTRGDVLNR